VYAWFRKLKAGLVKSDINLYVGTKGEMFFNTETGEFRISDGATPGGQPIPSARFLLSLRGVRDIDFDSLGDGKVLSYSQIDDQFVWSEGTELLPKFTKYIQGLIYTIERQEHGVQSPTIINVYDPQGYEVSVEILLVDGNITLISNVDMAGHRVSIS
jgi:hypothetical protein